MDATCFNWIQVIKKDQDLSFHSKAIAMYLATFMNLEHDMAWPSQQRIADELGISKPTVIKYIKELKDKGFLTITKLNKFGKGGEQEYNCYHVDLPRKVVKEINHLTSKKLGVVNESDKGSKPDTSKVVNHVNPNNNINNKRITSSSGDEPFLKGGLQEEEIDWEKYGM